MKDAKFATPVYWGITDQWWYIYSTGYAFCDIVDKLTTKDFTQRRAIGFITVLSPEKIATTIFTKQESYLNAICLWIIPSGKLHDDKDFKLKHRLVVLVAGLFDLRQTWMWKSAYFVHHPHFIRFMFTPRVLCGPLVHLHCWCLSSVEHTAVLRLLCCTVWVLTNTQHCLQKWSLVNQSERPRRLNQVSEWLKRHVCLVILIKQLH